MAYEVCNNQNRKCSLHQPRQVFPFILRVRVFSLKHNWLAAISIDCINSRVKVLFTVA